MFNYKNAALLLSKRISVASHVAVGAVVTKVGVKPLPSGMGI